MKRILGSDAVIRVEWPVKTSGARRQRGVAGNTGLRVALAVLTGMAAGVGGYTVVYAEGLSYMSADRKVRANCHIMNSQVDSWQKCSHHAVAGCVDGHLPHDFIGKWTAKALNGYHNSMGFTLQGPFGRELALKSWPQVYRICKTGDLGAASLPICAMAPLSVACGRPLPPPRGALARPPRPALTGS